MATFAIVSEGKTDQVIIDRIIRETCGAVFDRIVVRYARPSIDATDAKTASHGNWELVLDYCKNNIGEALEANDYVVIQIDTDCGDHEKFGLQLTQSGQERFWSDLVDDAEKILISKIGQELFDENSTRFIFAVAVHSSEAWLLTYLYDDERTKNCFDHLRYTIKKNKTLKSFSKDVRSYEAIARTIKSKRLLSLTNGNHSLGRFLRNLGALEEKEEEEVSQATPVI